MNTSTNQVQTSNLFIQASCNRRSQSLLQSDSIHDFGHRVSSSTIMTPYSRWTGLIVATVFQYDGFCPTLTRSSSASIELDCCPWTSLASTFIHWILSSLFFFLPSIETVASHADQLEGSWDTRIIVDVPTWVWWVGTMRFYMLH